MSSRNLSRSAMGVLVILGAACLFLRFNSLQAERVANQESLWRLSCNVTFSTQQSDAVVEIALPNSFPQATIVNEELTHANLVERFRTSRISGNRELVVTAKHPGTYEVNAEFDIRLEPLGQPRTRGAAEALTPDTRARYLRREELLPVQSSQIQRVLRDSPAGDVTEEALLQWLFEACARDLRATTPEEEGDDVDWALANRKASPLGKARALVTLCRATRIPARLVTGIELRQTSLPREHVWVEVFRGHNWVPFDPVYGYARNLPGTFIPLRRGGEQAVRGEGVADLNVTYSILRLPPSVVVLESEQRHPTQILDLTRLPLEIHEVMSLMLLLPLGALVTAIMRNVVGIRTFGTFTPALLAMSFIYADWGTGVVILSVVMVAGLVGRVLLERLHLLMVPRLSVILTMVILCVVFGVSSLDYLALTPSAQAVLLPLVILTIMIERFYVASEEDGVLFSIQLALGTLFVAALCYLLLGWEDVGEFILVYPEAHLLTLAAFIFIGRYAGYRLTELWRFRDLAREGEAA